VICASVGQAHSPSVGSRKGAKNKKDRDTTEVREYKSWCSHGTRGEQTAWKQTNKPAAIVLILATLVLCLHYGLMRRIEKGSPQLRTSAVWSCKIIRRPRSAWFFLKICGPRKFILYPPTMKEALVHGALSECRLRSPREKTALNSPIFRFELRQS